jgi:hypothetical protein
MATQEPNVYAGLAVVIGGLMHARPKFFAKVMGELLFWVGEDKMLFGSDYAIWEPKWQVEGFVDWEMPDDTEQSDYPRLGTEGKKKIMGLNAAKLLRSAPGPSSRRWRRCATPSSTSRSPRSGSSRRAPSRPPGRCRSGCACLRTSARPTSPS